MFIQFVSRKRPGRIALLAALVALFCLWAPLANAQAADRYAAPSGSDETGHCLNPASPCSLPTALKAENSADGDTILLAPGTYEEEVETLEIPHSVTVSGEPGEAAPTISITGSSPEPGVLYPGWGFTSTESVTLRDLRIHADKYAYAGFDLEGEDNLVERVEATGTTLVACWISSGTVKDSLCRGEDSRRGTGIRARRDSASPPSTTLELLNVTAIGVTTGIDAFISEGGGNLTVSAENTIAFSETEEPIGDETDGAYDVRTSNEAGETGSSLAIVLSNSNFSSALLRGETTISSPTENGNQSTPPVFVNPAAGNFREDATSPTRLAGDAGAVESGDLDLDQQERATTCQGETYVDIGAYELAECSPPSAQGDGGGAPESTITNTAPTDASGSRSTTALGPLTPATSPRLSGLKLKHPRPGARGATISFTLSTAAEVKLEVLRVKRADAGGAKLVPLGALPPIAGAAGPNLARFSGVLKGRPLDPGKYTLRAVATAGSLSSAPATSTFTVLAPGS